MIRTDNFSDIGGYNPALRKHVERLAVKKLKTAAQLPSYNYLQGNTILSGDPNK